jgi:hypothetical protein
MNKFKRSDSNNFEQFKPKHKPIPIFMLIYFLLDNTLSLFLRNDDMCVNDL